MCPRYNTPHYPGMEPRCMDDPCSDVDWLLKDCEEPVPAGWLDFNGEWSTDDGHYERVEQCGDRLIIVGGKVIHDAVHANGNFTDGVHDIAVRKTGTVVVKVAVLYNETARCFDYWQNGITADGEPIVRRCEGANGNLELEQPFLNQKMGRAKDARVQLHRINSTRVVGGKYPGNYNVDVIIIGHHAFNRLSVSHNLE